MSDQNKEKSTAIELTKREELMRDALRNTDKQGSEATVMFGIIGGIVAGAFINPFVGGFVALGVAGSSFLNQCGRATKRRQMLTGKTPLLSLLSDDEIDEYKEEIGEEQFTIELQKLDTNDSWGVMSDDIKQLAITEQVKFKNNGINPVEQLADYHTRNCLILGASGDGKDICVSNTLRKLKQDNPNLKIFVLDAKGLPREKGYYEPVADVFESKQCGEIADNEIVCEWFKQQFNKFLELSKADDNQWLFISTEQTLIGDAFQIAKDDYLKSVLNKQTPTGSGFDRGFWFLAQNPNLESIGMSGNSRGQLKTFAVSHKTNINNVCNQWSRTGVVGKPKKKELQALCNSSPIERCFYSPDTGEWHPMPELQNYSSYNRDKRQRIKPCGGDKESLTVDSTTVIQSEQPTVIQGDNRIESMFEKLMESPTTDILETLKTQFPDIPNSSLKEVIKNIEAVAKQTNNQALLSKFF